MKNILFTAFKYTMYTLTVLMAIFCGATCFWMYLKDYSFEIDKFKEVLSSILINAGSYSTLLVGVVITICFQIYTKERELEKENQIKIQEVGYYTLAFKGKEDTYKEDFSNEKIVSVINDDRDYFLGRNNKQNCMIKFLTSKKNSTNLKNVMAFEDIYFQRNKRNILKNYYDYCNKIQYISPLYCETKPTSELINKNEADKNRYFWLVFNDINMKSNEIVDKIIWISAITEEGIMLFIEVKVRFCSAKQGVQINLMQQTTYYKSENRICPLYD